MKCNKYKQMLVDVVLQGRIACFYGEETEIFAAKSPQHLHAEFQEDWHTEDEINNGSLVISRDWRYWWQPGMAEKESDLKTGKQTTKGAPIYKPGSNCIQWTGDNPEAVIKFTGKAKNFNKWFSSMAAFKEHLERDGKIFKLFRGDCCVAKAKPGDYIVRTGEGNKVVTADVVESRNLNFERLPIICFVYGGADDNAQISTSYN